MRYVLLVSHGMFAPGLKSAVEMMTGPREDLLAVSLPDGSDVDEFEANVTSALTALGPNDELIVLADILGGSPLTTTLKVLASQGLLGRTSAALGMNMPLVISAMLEKDAEPSREALMARIVTEARGYLAEYDLTTLAVDDDEDEL